MKAEKKQGTNGANLGFEQKLWLAADKLRSNMDAAEYKHVVLGLIFLKYISDAFTEVHEKLEKEPETNLCPCCKVKLVEIHKEEYDPVVPPDEYFEGFVDPKGWCLVYDEKESEEPYCYNYASTRHLNEIIKGIATAN
jgi:type I restriction-modification system DNA methylase subunit